MKITNYPLKPSALKSDIEEAERLLTRSNNFKEKKPRSIKGRTNLLKEATHAILLAKGELDIKYTRKNNKATRCLDMHRTKDTNKKKVPVENPTITILRKLGYQPHKSKLNKKIKELHRRFKAEVCSRREKPLRNMRRKDIIINLVPIDRIINLYYKANRTLNQLNALPVIIDFVTVSKKLNPIWSSSNYTTLYYGKLERKYLINV